jgi:hypothetical protein
MRKKISPAIFGLALICFFLPWTTVSCQQQKAITFTGIQLVTGTTVKQPQLFGVKQSKEVRGESHAVIAMILVVAGFIVSIIPGSVARVASALAGGITAILLLMLKAKIDSDILREGGGLIQINYEIGFYLTLLLSLSTIAMSVFLSIYDKEPLQQTYDQVVENRFCTACGIKNDNDAAFCIECGKSFR